jgi:hypothetical protein
VKKLTQQFLDGNYIQRVGVARRPGHEDLYPEQIPQWIKSSGAGYRSRIGASE